MYKLAYHSLQKKKDKSSYLDFAALQTFVTSVYCECYQRYNLALQINTWHIIILFLGPATRLRGPRG